MLGMFTAKFAEFLIFYSLGMLPFILRRCIIPVFALCTFQSNIITQFKSSIL